MVFSVFIYAILRVLDHRCRFHADDLRDVEQKRSCKHTLCLTQYYLFLYLIALGKRTPSVYCLLISPLVHHNDIHAYAPMQKGLSSRWFS